MKAFFYFLISSLPLMGLGQILPITNENWYLTKVEIAGEFFEIPDNGILGYETHFQESNADLNICNFIMLNYSNLNEESFFLTEFSSTLMECPEQPGLDNFEANFSSLFWDQENKTFTYTIENDSEWSHIHILIVTNPIGNKAYFQNGALGISDFSSEMNWVYPNPAQDYLSIENRNGKISRVELFDLNGQKVLTEKVSNAKIQLNLKGLAKGIYLLQIHSEKGIETKKIIKE